MTVHTFAGTYSITATNWNAGPPYTYGAFNAVSADMEDNLDGSNNDVTAVGDHLTIFGSHDAVLTGFTSNGDAVVFLGTFSRYYIFSNNPGLQGDTVGFTTAGGPYTYCFAQGTAIASPDGDRPVESLQIGDLVLTAGGRSVAVKWLGQQTVAKMFTGEAACPVRIRAGALGAGLPKRDLVVTGDHGIVLDGFLINASALVNGLDIDFVPLTELAERETYYHIETNAHDIVLAEGVAAETYLSVAGSRVFDNHSAYLDHYGTMPDMTEMPLPRISAARLLPDHLRRRLGSQAAERCLG